MKYIAIMAVPVALIAYHDAWGSIECPLLLCLGALVCVIIKSKRDERKKKEGNR